MDAQTSERLDRMIKERQALISAGTLKRELKQFGDEFPNDCDDSRYEFLDAVNLYDRSVRAGMTNSQHYVDLMQQFKEIEQTTPKLAFYIFNYMLLCARNAGSPHDEEIPKLFRQAVEVASNLPDDEREEALGHLYYNVARWEHKKGMMLQAYMNWQMAAGHRISFFKNLKKGQESPERLLAAAQQIWEMRGDFKKFFPEQGIDECGVTAQVIAELEQEFGSTVRLFSAKPS